MEGRGGEREGCRSVSPESTAHECAREEKPVPPLNVKGSATRHTLQSESEAAGTANG